MVISMIFLHDSITVLSSWFSSYGQANGDLNPYTYKEASGLSEWEEDMKD